MTHPNNTVEPLTEAELDAIDDLKTHAGSWRSAIVLARNSASPPTEDSNDTSYWQHELEKFDRSFAVLPRLISQARSRTLVEGEEGWLIEAWNSKTGEFRAEWWSLDPTEGEGVGAWVKDSLKALRFSRSIDAQAYINETGWTEARPTNHAWPALASCPTEGGSEPVGHFLYHKGVEAPVFVPLGNYLPEGENYRAQPLYTSPPLVSPTVGEK